MIQSCWLFVAALFGFDLGLLVAAWLQSRIDDGRDQTRREAL